MSTHSERLRIAHAPPDNPDAPNCYETRGWHGKRGADGRCEVCRWLIPPGPPDSPLPKHRNVP